MFRMTRLRTVMGEAASPGAWRMARGRTSLTIPRWQAGWDVLAALGKTNPNLKSRPMSEAKRSRQEDSLRQSPAKSRLVKPSQA